MCGAPLGLGESIGFVGATLSLQSTSIPSNRIHACVSQAQGVLPGLISTRYHAAESDLPLRLIIA